MIPRACRTMTEGSLGWHSRPLGLITCNSGTHQLVEGLLLARASPKIRSFTHRLHVRLQAERLAFHSLADNQPSCNVRPEHIGTMMIRTGFLGIS